MNYRHDYHAGNFADVLKHAILALIIDYLKRKDSPFMALDAHAGPGLYDLSGIEAQKTGEWQGGIGRLWSQPCPPALDPWLEVVRGFNPDGTLLTYPGSPKLFQSLLRPRDRLVLIEKHPQDHERLAQEFCYDRRVHVHLDDAYAHLKAALPPPERRGLVLIDPPYEEKDEFQKMLRSMQQALKRWPTGTYCLWYPIKARDPIDQFWSQLKALNPPPTLTAEVMIRASDDPFRLNGCGLAILNPPWVLEDQLEQVLPFLAQTLVPGGGAAHFQWLVTPA
jgi:23S rRNA (adenine2030-N6)-methyltransferase